jgi:hypothetical protein
MLTQRRAAAGPSVFRSTCTACSLPLVPTRDSAPESAQSVTDITSVQSIQDRVKEVNTRTQETPIWYQQAGIVKVVRNVLAPLLDKIWDKDGKLPTGKQVSDYGKRFAWYGSTPSLVTILQNLFPLKTKAPRQHVWPQLAERSLTNSTHVPVPLLPLRTRRCGWL